MTIGTKKLTFDKYLAHDDSQINKVTDLTLVAGLYKKREYPGSQPLKSQFQTLLLAAGQVLGAKR